MVLRLPDVQPSTLPLGSGTERLEQSLAGLVAMGRLMRAPSGTLNTLELDYSLLEIFPHVAAFLLEDDIPPNLVLSGYAMKKPIDTAITSITASVGTLRGTLSGTPTYQIVAGSQTTKELWTVRLHGTLTKGDCGSWVVDEESGDLVGHVVAGSPQSGVAYIVPACHVFQDAKKKFRLHLKPLSTWHFDRGSAKPDLSHKPNTPLATSPPFPQQLRTSSLPLPLDPLYLKRHRNSDDNYKPVIGDMSFRDRNIGDYARGNEMRSASLAPQLKDDALKKNKS